MRETLVYIFFLFLTNLTQSYGQNDLIPSVDSIPQQKKAESRFSPDSIPPMADRFQELSRDTVNPNANTNISISENALEDKVEYSAKDSINYDNKKNKVHLYGNASVKYQQLELTAGYIVVDLDSNIALAQMHLDSVGKISGRPTFSDGSQNFDALKMRYNFKSQKGIVFDVATTQSNLFLRGTKTKFITEDNGIKDDTSAADNILFNRDAIFSTCNLPHPHYGIRSRKQKIVANKVVVVGPSNLELGGVPTPVWLPFGFFPLKQFKSTGLIFPQGYEYSPQWGFGLDGVGWYFPLSDYYDLRLTGQIYWHGTFGITANSNYRRRYKYNGSVTLSYARQRSIDAPESPATSYAIRWNHSQDGKAHPTRRLSGNVNIQGNGYQSRVNNDAQSVLQNTLSSNVSYTQSFPGKPYRFTASMSHSQNTGTNRVNITLPSFNFQMDRVFPFKNKEASASAKEKWYEKISFRYNGRFENRVTATDTTLFSQETLDNARFGFKHDMSTDLQFNLLKYINVSPNATFNEVWYFHSIKEYLDTLGMEPDIAPTFQPTRDTLFGFKPWHQFSTGISMNTQLFGTLNFKARKGRLKGIRHTVKPSVAFNFTPDYSSEDGFFGGLIQSYDRDTSDAESITRYSVFQGNIFGSPSTGTAGRQMALSYSINNIFEAKFRPKFKKGVPIDSTDKRQFEDKKIKLFNNIRIGGNYNFAADSLKFSQVSANGTTRLFQGITNFSFNIRWDPYDVDENNRRINTFYWRTRGKLLRFVDARFTFNSTISVSALKKLFKKDDSRSSSTSRTSSRDAGQGAPQQEDSFLKFLEGFNLRHNFVLEAKKNVNGVTEWDTRTHSVNLSISAIQLTQNWSIRVGNIGYDFVRKRTTYPDFGINRDLHCWRASFNWQPQRGTYYFTIQVKNPPLDVLKIPYSKNQADGRFRGF